MRLLVCGGRTYGVTPDDATPQQAAEAERERAELYVVLNLFHLQTPVTELCNGIAKGADALSSEWARANGIEPKEFPADWARFGKGAGSERNRQMLREFEPEIAIAFPGQAGTTDMISAAKAHGVRVLNANDVLIDYALATSRAEIIVDIAQAVMDHLARLQSPGPAHTEDVADDPATGADPLPTTGR